MRMSKYKQIVIRYGNGWCFTFIELKVADAFQKFCEIMDEKDAWITGPTGPAPHVTVDDI
jgi:hypothetical protein